jgi:hypothetical protein
MAVTDTSRVKTDDAKYVLHSWSVRSAIDPIPVAGAEGRYFWDFDGNRYLDFASQLVNVSLGPPAPEGDRGDQGAGGSPDDDRADDGERAALRAGAAARGGHRPGT